MRAHRTFGAFASRVAKVAGSAPTFFASLLIVLIWAALGPYFNYSQTWQLVINTGTTIVTFLMVFLIQNTQNRDSLAIQTKLDELILTSDAENEFIGIERLSDAELEALHARCARAAARHDRLALRAEQEIATRKGVRHVRRDRTPA